MADCVADSLGLGAARHRLFPIQRRFREMVGASAAGQAHDPGLDDETAEFDPMPRVLTALDLPCRAGLPQPEAEPIRDW